MKKKDVTKANFYNSLLDGELVFFTDDRLILSSIPSNYYVYYVRSFDDSSDEIQWTLHNHQIYAATIELKDVFVNYYGTILSLKPLNGFKDNDYIEINEKRPIIINWTDPIRMPVNKTMDTHDVSNTSEIEISFNVEVNNTFVDELAKIVNHHIDYLLRLEDFDEIKSVYSAKIKTK